MMLFSPYIPPVLFFQSVSDVKEVISTNDATIQGVLLGVILALGGVVIYLYRDRNKIMVEYVDYIKQSNEITREYAEKMRDVTESNKELVQMLEKMYSRERT